MSSELFSLRRALRPAIEKFAAIAATDFGPKALKIVRQTFVESGCCRGTCNRYSRWLVRLFKWGASEELIPGECWHRLAAVESLRIGRTEAPEPEKVGPVDNTLVDATLPYLLPEVAAMVRLQLLTGMRSGELVIMRARDIDQNGPVWKYRPSKHKTMHRGKTREIPLGPKAQAILTSYLSGSADAFIFSPAEAEQDRRDRIHNARTTPICCGNRPGKDRVAKAERQPGERYTVDAYRRSIERAADRAFVAPPHLARKMIIPTGRKKQARIETPVEWKTRLTAAQREELAEWRRQHRWHPHQLRHSFATRIARGFGEVDAQITLGHSDLKTTAIYAERNWGRAEAIAAEVG